MRLNHRSIMYSFFAYQSSRKFQSFSTFFNDDQAVSSECFYGGNTVVLAFIRHLKGISLPPGWPKAAHSGVEEDQLAVG